jgi:hypothetical protein
MTLDTTNWYEWHKAYVESKSLRQRLERVRAHIADALDAMPTGAVRVVSVCAGDGRDLISVLRDHPRGRDVTATLLELDPRLVDDGRDLARASGVEGNVEFLQTDATQPDVYVGRIPCDLLMTCGVFGNIVPETTASLVALASAACTNGGRLIWTRNASRNNGEGHIATIQRLLSAASFDEARLDIIDDEDDGQSERLALELGAGRHVVVSNVHRAKPQPPPSGELFRFVGFKTLEKEG